MHQPELANQFMVKSLVTLRPDMHVFDGIAHLLKQNITGAPVVDAGRKYLGVFSEKCCMSVLTAVGAGGSRRRPRFAGLGCRRRTSWFASWLR